MKDIYYVKEEALLLDFLYKNIKHKSKNNIKKILVNSVLVDDKKVSNYAYLLKKGQIVKIVNHIVLKNNITLDIIYEDKDIIVINKPSGLLTIATKKEKEKTLYHYVLDYLKIKREKIFIVHRLDRDTSGVVMFAKKERIKNVYQNNWNSLVIKRGYMAIVKGKIDAHGTIKSYLKENKEGIVYISKDKKGKEAITNYVRVKSNNNYSLVDIDIKTGRKNQIRVHMHSIGYPIVGDRKYGCQDNILKRLGLHAYVLEIVNPLNKKKMTFRASLPDCFSKINF